MDSTPPQNFAAYSPIAQLNPSPHAPNHLHASVNDPSWNHSRISAHAVSMTPGHSPSMFPAPDRSTDLEYPSPATSSSNASPPYAHPQRVEHYATHTQSPTVSMNSSNESILSHLSQSESRVGPSRVMTRRQRAQMEQKSLGRRVSLRRHFQRTEQAHSPVRLIFFPHRLFI